MARITVDVPDSVLQQIDSEAKQINASRSKWAANAIDAYLHQKGITDDADLMQMKDQVMQLRQQLDAKTQECDAKSQKIMHLNDEIAKRDDDLDRLRQQIKESGSEATQRWEELKGIRNDNTKLKKDLDAAQATIQRLQGELLAKQAEIDRITALRDELATAKTNRDRLQEALKVRDDDIAWLRGHVAQLTQQLALPPSIEEAKKKGWWQFWK